MDADASAHPEPVEGRRLVKSSLITTAIIPRRDPGPVFKCPNKGPRLGEAHQPGYFADGQGVLGQVVDGQVAADQVFDLLVGAAFGFEFAAQGLAGHAQFAGDAVEIGEAVGHAGFDQQPDAGAVAFVVARFEEDIHR